MKSSLFSNKKVIALEIGQPKKIIVIFIVDKIKWYYIAQPHSQSMKYNVIYVHMKLTNHIVYLDLEK